MNTKNLLLSIFILMTIVLASLTLIERGQITTFNTTTTVTQKTTIFETVTNTSTIVQSTTGACLEEVPQSAVISNAQNTTFQGYSVTYSNGTTDFFSINSCPVPVTPDKYQVYFVIEANPQFIAAENGSAYEASPFGAQGGISNSTGQYSVFTFVLYGSQTIYPCGGSKWEYKELGAIQATIPINSTGGLQFSNTEIQTIPENDLNVFSCTTTLGP
jgi:hypothetical protein